MCGRVVQDLDIAMVEEFFNLAASISVLPSNWNLSPKQNAGVIRRNPDSGLRTLSVLNWGLVPSWADPAHKYSTFNAKSEEIQFRKFYREAWAAGRRCILPITAFYEWKETDRPPKQPFAIGRADGLPLAIAGLWEGKQLENGEILRTFTIITTAANELMKPLHHRMPVILDSTDWAVWLGEVDSDLEQVAELMKPYPDEKLKTWPVSRAVGNIRNNVPELIQAIS